MKLCCKDQSFHHRYILREIFESPSGLHPIFLNRLILQFFQSCKNIIQAS
ncbi:hypothetical protein D1BOALGB6SA_2825 [Olavius sp. associated proteobacterium Delta 1]|nr:hypothetical protein D1BOALGB6SA_2825 [Olavius sp. associated proteobacterium Delta 1]